MNKSSVFLKEKKNKTLTPQSDQINFYQCCAFQNAGDWKVISKPTSKKPRRYLKLTVTSKYDVQRSIINVQSKQSQLQYPKSWINYQSTKQTQIQSNYSQSFQLLSQLSRQDFKKLSSKSSKKDVQKQVQSQQQNEIIDEQTVETPQKQQFQQLKIDFISQLKSWSGRSNHHSIQSLDMDKLQNQENQKQFEFLGDEEEIEDEIGDDEINWQINESGQVHRFYPNSGKRWMHRDLHSISEVSLTYQSTDGINSLNSSFNTYQKMNLNLCQLVPDNLSNKQNEVKQA